MSQGITVPVNLQIQNLQSLVGDLQKQLGNLKVGSSGFQAVQQIIMSIRKEIDKLSVQTAKPFINASQFTKAESSVDKLEDKLVEMGMSIQKIKFSDLELSAGQKADLKAFEDSINSIKDKLKTVKQSVKQDFLDSTEGKQWLQIDSTATTQSLDKITQAVARAARDQKEQLDGLKQKASDYQKALSESQRIKDFTDKMVDDPANGTDIFSKKWQELTKQLSNNKIVFKEGGKNLMVQWLESQLKLDSGVLDSLLKSGVSAANIGQKLKQLLNDQLAKDQDIITNNSGAEAAAQAASQEYDKLDSILQRVGLSEQQIAQVTTALGASLRDTANAQKEYEQELVKTAQKGMDVSTTTDAMKTQLDNLRSTLSQTNAQFIQMQRTQQSFNQMKMAIVNFMGFNQVLNLTKTAVKNAMNHIKELDTVMNKISIVTDMSTGDLWNQVDQYSKMAQSFGVSIKGAYEVSQIYYQQGLETKDVMTLTNETLKLAKISGLDYATTTDYMTTALRGFKMEMQDASTVVDVYSNLAAHTAVSQEELAVAMSKTASSMESVGATFEESSAMIATMVAVTRESATNIGSAMKSIASRYGELTKDPTKLVDEEGEAMAFNKVDAALQSVGISMKTVDGQFREFTDVIVELGEKWDELDSTQQRYIATQFAGNRQQSRFLALVSNVDLLKSNLDVAMNSEDTGTLQALKALDSIESKTEQVKVAYQQFYTTIGAEDVWKGFLDGATNVINTLNSLPKLFGKIPVGAISAISSIVTLIKHLGSDLLGAFADTFGQSFMQGILSASGKATEGAESLVGIILNTIRGKKGEAEAVGKELAEATAKGASDGSVKLTTEQITQAQRAQAAVTTISSRVNLNDSNVTEGMVLGAVTAAKQTGKITSEEYDQLTVSLDGIIQRTKDFIAAKQQEADTLKNNNTSIQQSTNAFKTFISQHKNLGQGLQSFGSALNMIAMTINTTAEGGKTLSGTLQTIAGTATIAGIAIKAMQAAFTNTQFAVPWMAAISGVMMLINGLSTLIVTPQERLEELTQKAEDLNNAAKQAKADYNILDRSIKKIDELKEKRYESAAAAEEYQTAVDELAEKFPQMIAGFDEAGNIILNTTDSERLLAAAREKSAQATYNAVKAEYDAAKETSNQAVKNVQSAAQDVQSDMSQNFEEAIKTAEYQRYSSLYDSLNNIINNSNSSKNDKDMATKIIAALSLNETSYEEQFSVTQVKALGEQFSWLKNQSFYSDLISNSAIEQLVNDLTELSNMTDLSSQAAIDKINEIKNLLKNNSFEGFDINSLEESFGDLFKEFNTAFDLSAIISSYKRQIISAWQKTTLNDNKSWSYLEESASAAALATDAITRTWEQYEEKRNEGSFEVNETNYKAIIQTANEYGGKGIDYMHEMELFWNQLNDVQKQLFDKMFSDTGTYTAEDFNIEEFSDISNFNIIFSMLQNYYSKGIESIQERLNANLAKSMGKEINEVTGKYDKIHFEGVHENNFYEQFYDSMITAATTTEENVLNGILKQYDILTKQGFTEQASTFGIKALKLYDELSIMPTEISKNIWSAINNNGFETLEDIDKIQQAIELSSASESQKSNLNMYLNQIATKIIPNITLSIQSFMDELMQGWEDASKTLSNLSNGLNLTEVEGIIEQAKQFENVNIDFSSFETSGNKLVLTEQVASQYWDAYFKAEESQVNRLVERYQVARAQIKDAEGEWNTLIKDELTSDSWFGIDQKGVQDLFSNLQIILGSQFDSYIETIYDETGVVSGWDFKDEIDFDTLNKALNEADTALSEYENNTLQIIRWQREQIEKAAQWKKGDYSTIYKDERNNIKDWDDLYKLTSSSIDISSYSNAVKEGVSNIQNGISTMISDLLSKGKDYVAKTAYEGIDKEKIEFNDNTLKLSYKDIVVKYANHIGKSISEMNDLLAQAIQKDNELKSVDLIKDFTFMDKSHIKTTLNGLKEFANKLGVKLEEIVYQGNAALDSYTVDLMQFKDKINLDTDAMRATIQDSINSFWADLISSISKGISGSLSNMEVGELQQLNWSIGNTETLDFTSTAEGLKLTEKSIYQLYTTLKATNAESAKKLLPSIKEMSKEYDNIIDAMIAYKKALEQNKPNKANAAKDIINQNLLTSVDAYDVNGSKMPLNWQQAEMLIKSITQTENTITGSSKTGQMSFDAFYDLFRFLSSQDNTKEQKIAGMTPEQLIKMAPSAFGTDKNGNPIIDLTKLGFKPEDYKNLQLYLYDAGISLLQFGETWEQTADTLNKGKNKIDISSVIDESGNIDYDQLYKTLESSAELYEAFSKLNFNGKSLTEILLGSDPKAIEDMIPKDMLKNLLLNFDDATFDTEHIQESLQNLFGRFSKDINLELDENGIAQFTYNLDSANAEFKIGNQTVTSETFSEWMNATAQENAQVFDKGTTKEITFTINGASALLTIDGEGKTHYSVTSPNGHQIEAATLGELKQALILAAQQESVNTVNDVDTFTGGKNYNFKIDNLEYTVEISGEGNVVIKQGDTDVTSQYEQNIQDELKKIIEGSNTEASLDSQTVNVDNLNINANTITINGSEAKIPLLDNLIGTITHYDSTDDPNIWVSELQAIITNYQNGGNPNTLINNLHAFVTKYINNGNPDELVGKLFGKIVHYDDTDDPNSLVAHLQALISHYDDDDDPNKLVAALSGFVASYENIGNPNSVVSALTARIKEYKEQPNVKKPTLEALIQYINQINTEGADAALSAWRAAEEAKALEIPITSYENDQPYNQGEHNPPPQDFSKIAGSRGSVYRDKNDRYEYIPNYGTNYNDLSLPEGWTLGSNGHLYTMEVPSVSFKDIETGEILFPTDIEKPEIPATAEVDEVDTSNVEVPTVAGEMYVEEIDVSEIENQEVLLKGKVIQGNVDLENRPHILNDDGSISTVFSHTMDSGEFELPEQSVPWVINITPIFKDGSGNGKQLSSNDLYEYVQYLIDKYQITDAEGLKQADAVELGLIIELKETTEADLNDDIQAMIDRAEALHDDEELQLDGEVDIETTAAEDAIITLNDALEGVEPNVPVAINETGASEAAASINSVADAEDRLHDKTITVTQNVVDSSSSQVRGNVALAAGTLMGELGPELVVSHGRYFVVGQNGAEMVNLDKDAVVFNHIQTQQLLGNGKTSRGNPITNARIAAGMATGNVQGQAYTFGGSNDNGNPSVLIDAHGTLAMSEAFLRWQRSQRQRGSSGGGKVPEIKLDGLTKDQQSKLASLISDLITKGIDGIDWAEIEKTFGKDLAAEMKKVAQNGSLRDFVKKYGDYCGKTLKEINELYFQAWEADLGTRGETFQNALSGLQFFAGGSVGGSASDWTTILSQYGLKISDLVDKKLLKWDEDLGTYVLTSTERLWDEFKVDLSGTHKVDSLTSTMNEINDLLEQAINGSISEKDKKKLEDELSKSGITNLGEIWTESGALDFTKLETIRKRIKNSKTLSDKQKEQWLAQIDQLVADEQEVTSSLIEKGATNGAGLSPEDKANLIKRFNLVDSDFETGLDGKMRLTADAYSRVIEEAKKQKRTTSAATQSLLDKITDDYKKIAEETSNLLEEAVNGTISASDKTSLLNKLSKMGLNTKLLKWDENGYLDISSIQKLINSDEFKKLPQAVQDYYKSYLTDLTTNYNKNISNLITKGESTSGEGLTATEQDYLIKTLGLTEDDFTKDANGVLRLTADGYKRAAKLAKEKGILTQSELDDKLAAVEDSIREMIQSITDLLSNALTGEISRADFNKLNSYLDQNGLSKIADDMVIETADGYILKLKAVEQMITDINNNTKLSAEQKSKLSAALKDGLNENINSLISFFENASTGALSNADFNKLKAQLIALNINIGHDISEYTTETADGVVISMLGIKKVLSQLKHKAVQTVQDKKLLASLQDTIRNISSSTSDLLSQVITGEINSTDLNQLQTYLGSLGVSGLANTMLTETANGWIVNLQNIASVSAEIVGNTKLPATARRKLQDSLDDAVRTAVISIGDSLSSLLEGSMSSTDLTKLKDSLKAAGLSLSDSFLTETANGWMISVQGIKKLQKQLYTNTTLTAAQRRALALKLEDALRTAENTLYDLLSKTVDGTITVSEIDNLNQYLKQHNLSTISSDAFKETANGIIVNFEALQKVYKEISESTSVSAEMKNKMRNLMETVYSNVDSLISDILSKTAEDINIDDYSIPADLLAKIKTTAQEGYAALVRSLSDVTAATTEQYISNYINALKKDLGIDVGQAADGIKIGITELRSETSEALAAIFSKEQWNKLIDANAITIDRQTGETIIDRAKMNATLTASELAEISSILDSGTETYFAQQKKALSETDSHYKTMSSTLERIKELQEKIQQTNKYSKEKINQYKEELELAKQIAATRATSEDSSMNFLDNEIPGAFNNPLNYVNDWITVWKNLRDNAEKGVMDFKQLYNAAKEMNSTAAQTGNSINFLGYTLDGSTESFTKFVQAMTSALGSDSDGNFGVLLNKMGTDLKDASTNYADAADDALHNMAKAQIKILDALISFFEAIVAMEKFEGADINSNGLLDLNEIFKLDKLGEATTEFTNKYKKAANQILKAAESNVDLDNALTKIMLNGYTLKELLEDAKDGTLNLEGVDQKTYQQMMSVIYEAFAKGDYDLNNIAESLLTALSNNESGFSGIIDLGDIAISPKYKVQVTKNEDGTWTADDGTKCRTAAEAINRNIADSISGGADKTVNANGSVKSKQFINGIPIDIEVKDGEVTYTYNGESNLTKEQVLDKMYQEYAEGFQNGTKTGKQLSREEWEATLPVTSTTHIQKTKDGKWKVGDQTFNNWEDAVQASTLVEMGGKNAKRQKVKINGVQVDVVAADMTLSFDAYDENGNKKLDKNGKVEQVTIDYKIVYNNDGTVGYSYNGKIYSTLDEVHHAMWEKNGKAQGLSYEEWEYKVGLKVLVDPTTATDGTGLTREQINQITNTTWQDLQDQFGKSWEELTDEDKLALSVKYGVDLTKINSEEEWQELQSTLNGEKKIVASLNIKELQFQGKDILSINEKGEIQSNLSTSATLGINDEASEKLKEIQAAIDAITGEKEIKFKIVTEGELPKAQPGTYIMTVAEQAQVKGNVALAAGRTLMGELGPELVVSKGRYFTVGNNGAEFVDLPKDAIVFNHLQTKRLLSNGSTGRGVPAVNEVAATSLAAGNALAGASETLATLKQLRAMWQSLLNSSIKDLVGTTAISGDGGSSSRTGAWLAQVERWYKLLQRIAGLEKQINIEEAKRSELQSRQIKDGNAIYQIDKKELDWYKQIAAAERQLADETLERYRVRKEELNNSPMAAFYKYEDNGEITFDADAFAKLQSVIYQTDEGKTLSPQEQFALMQEYVGKETWNKYSSLDASGLAIEREEGETDESYYQRRVEAGWTRMENERTEMQSLWDSYMEHEQNYYDELTKGNTILNNILQNQRDLEDKVLTAIEKQRQDTIDTLTEEREALSDSATKYITSLTDALNKEKAMYEDSQSEADLAKLRRQLSILQRSGGSASQIADLQSQIAEKDRDAYYEAQQDSIDAVQEASDLELEKLQEQIDLMTETLEYEKEHGLLWKKVEEIMAQDSGSIIDFIQGNSDDWASKSPLAKSQDTQDLKESVEQWTSLLSDENSSVWTYLANGFKAAVDDYYVNNNIEKTPGDFGDADVENPYIKRNEGKYNYSPNAAHNGSGTDNDAGGVNNLTNVANGEVNENTVGLKKYYTATNTLLYDYGPIDKDGKHIESGKAETKELVLTAKGKTGSLDTKEAQAAAASALDAIMDTKKKEIEAKNKKHKKHMYENFRWKNTDKDGKGTHTYAYAGYGSYRAGGEVNYTGTAEVHGSNERPEYMLNADEYQVWKHQIVGGGNTSLMSRLSELNAMIGHMEDTRSYEHGRGEAFVIENASVNMYVDEIANDYDAQRAGEQALEKIMQIARKSSSNNRIGR